jgi:hypothetical protein
MLFTEQTLLPLENLQASLQSEMLAVTLRVPSERLMFLIGFPVIGEDYCICGA